MRLNYIKGDATKPVYSTTGGTGKRLILHICNDENAWGSGFVVALNNAFGKGPDSPVAQYHGWYTNAGVPRNATGPFKLGQVQFVDVDDEMIVVNMIAQSTPGGYNGFPPIRYQSLEECLLRIKARVLAYQQKGGKITLGGPRFGSGLAGGVWSEIEEIIKRVFKDVDVDFNIYDI